MLFFHLPAIDDEDDIVDGDGRFRNVGGEDDLLDSTGHRFKDELLVLSGQGTVER